MTFRAFLISPIDDQERYCMSASDSIDRRTFITRGAGVLGAAALVRPSALLQSGRITRVIDRVAPEVTSAAKKRRGGTLIVGSLGGTADTINAQHNSTNIDQQRAVQLYEGLTYISENLPFTYENALAQEIELSSDLKTGTVRLKQGLEFHNGKTVSADDLIFTIQRELTKTGGGPGHGTAGYASINPNAMTKLDDRTVQFALNFPDAYFPRRIGVILPIGYDPLHPVGAGPFMFQSYTAGSQSTFVRFPNYWNSPEPFLDEVQIIDFADDQSRVSAMLAGQINAIDGIDTSLLSEFSDHTKYKKLIAKAGYYQPITMRVDLPPFNDVRVRQAMRLLVNRPQMVQQAENGYAHLGNDMPDPADPAYPHDLPQRHQDIPEAKRLLKAAGYPNLTVTMTIAPQDGGIVKTAQVFAEQAAAAGVTVNLTNLTIAAYQAGFTNWPFTQGYWAAGLIGTGYTGRFLKGATNNDSHWNDPQTDAWYQQQLGTANAARRNAINRKIFETFYNDGPDIIHTFKDNVDVYSSKFTGFVPNLTGGLSLSQYRYRLVSLG